jgi:hypothetical protein
MAIQNDSDFIHHTFHVVIDNSSKVLFTFHSRLLLLKKTPSHIQVASASHSKWLKDVNGVCSAVLRGLVHLREQSVKSVRYNCIA